MTSPLFNTKIHQMCWTKLSLPSVISNTVKQQIFCNIKNKHQSITLTLFPECLTIKSSFTKMLEMNVFFLIGVTQMLDIYVIQKTNIFMKSRYRSELQAFQHNILLQVIQYVP